MNSTFAKVNRLLGTAKTVGFRSRRYWADYVYRYYRLKNKVIATEFTHFYQDLRRTLKSMKFV
jgi:hypothetical protein